tara:strand:- start:365 stop:598 length:234 start_codon:yes stop_codon:yes gene_type:complete
MEMASHNDIVYDGACLCGVTFGLSGRVDVRVYLGDMQLLLAIVFGVIALLYIGNRIKKQFNNIEKDPKCKDCPVPDE